MGRARMLAHGSTASAGHSNIASTHSHCLRPSRYHVSLPGNRRQLQLLVPRALPEGGEDFSDALKADLERLRAKSGAGAAGVGPGSSSPAGGPGRQPAEAAEAGPLSGAKDALDKLLIADFFLVLFILAWLAAGVAQAGLSEGGSSPLLDAWYPLWPVLWQPALGALMAGALVSGGIGWLHEQQQRGRQ